MIGINSIEIKMKSKLKIINFKIVAFLFYVNLSQASCEVVRNGNCNYIKQIFEIKN